MADEEKHEVVEYRGRMMCSCGHSDCYSLRLVHHEEARTESPQRKALSELYGPNWKDRVLKMSDRQVTAVYLRLKESGIL